MPWAKASTLRENNIGWFFSTRKYMGTSQLWIIFLVKTSDYCFFRATKPLLATFAEHYFNQLHG